MRAPDTPRGNVRFAGYAAVFNLLDRGGDIVQPGAFRRALDKAVRIPLLWQHQSGAVIGKIDTIEEDARGLRVIGTLNHSEIGVKAARLLQSEKVRGLSFGYRVRASEQSGGARVLTDVDLLEVSVVARPMQPKAVIHAVDPA